MPASEELWSLAALTDQAFRHTEVFSGPVTRMAGKTKLTPHETGPETPYTYYFPPTSCVIQKPTLCFYANLFCFYF